jgi:hypothetical protein
MYESGELITGESESFVSYSCGSALGVYTPSFLYGTKFLAIRVFLKLDVDANVSLLSDI